MADASDRTHFALLDLLGRHAVPFELTTHEPVETSEEVRWPLAACLRHNRSWVTLR